MRGTDEKPVANLGCNRTPIGNSVMQHASPCSHWRRFMLRKRRFAQQGGVGRFPAYEVTGPTMMPPDRGQCTDDNPIGNGMIEIRRANREIGLPVAEPVPGCVGGRAASLAPTTA